jgi:hypothetical protein
MDGWIKLGFVLTALALSSACPATDPPRNPDGTQAVSAIDDLANVSTSGAEGTIRLKQAADLTGVVQYQGREFFTADFPPSETARGRMPCREDGTFPPKPIFNADDSFHFEWSLRPRRYTQFDEALAIFERDHPNQVEDLASFRDRLHRQRLRLDECQIANQVRLTFRMVEIETQPYWDRIYGRIDNLWLPPMVPVFESAQQLFAIASLRDDPYKMTWNVPVITAQSGHPARASSGPEWEVSRGHPDGTQSVSRVTLGNSVVATATVFDFHRIHLQTTIELNDLGPVNESTGIPALVNRRRMEATLDVDHGQTSYIAQTLRSPSWSDRVLIVAVTADLVSPFPDE